MTPRLCVVIPAAGSGQRMAGATPKQYLPLAGRSVIDWALMPFLARADVQEIVVAISSGDTQFRSIDSSRDARVRTTAGGGTRADSVLAGLRALNASENDWVLVHDAARPCLHQDDLERLIIELANDEIGGLLATPVVDTLKFANANGRVLQTQSRDDLWRAQTPQMFRSGILQRGLMTAAASGKSVTDEAGAVELLRLQPRIVTGRADNIKITVVEDLRHAEFILQTRIKHQALEAHQAR